MPAVPPIEGAAQACRTAGGRAPCACCDTSPFYYVGKDRWEALTPFDRTLMRVAAHEAMTLTIAKYDQLNPGAVRRLVAGSAQLRSFPQDVMDACYKSANEVFAETGAGNELFKRLHDHLTAFRNEQNLWHQIAEYS